MKKLIIIATLFLTSCGGPPKKWLIKGEHSGVVIGEFYDNGIKVYDSGEVYAFHVDWDLWRNIYVGDTIIGVK